MQFRTRFEGRSATLYTEGRFTFNCHNDFRTNLLKLIGCTTLDLDLTECTYLDSSALGMILIARDRFPGVNIRLINAKGDVLKALNIANFGKLFYIK
jgi:anti-anti-sigma regulatory factor